MLLLAFTWLLLAALVILQLMQLVTSVCLAVGLKISTTPQLPTLALSNTHSHTLDTLVLCHTKSPAHIHTQTHTRVHMGFRVSITGPAWPCCG